MYPLRTAGMLSPNWATKQAATAAARVPPVSRAVAPREPGAAVISLTIAIHPPPFETGVEQVDLTSCPRQERGTYSLVARRALHYALRSRPQLLVSRRANFCAPTDLAQSYPQKVGSDRKLNQTSIVVAADVRYVRQHINSVDSTRDRRAACRRRIVARSARVARRLRWRIRRMRRSQPSSTTGTRLRVVHAVSRSKTSVERWQRTSAARSGSNAATICRARSSASGAKPS